MPPKKLTADSYRVGWICPLEVEQLAAMEMLDEEHMSLGQSPADHNVYKLGSINGHNVVIAGLPQTGNCPAATVVTQMRMTFQNLRYGLLVGIGGGVPVQTDRGMIRLGHVVVSKPTGEHSGAIQYDHGKAREGYFERTGSLMPPPAALLSAAQALAVQRDRMDYDPVWEDTLRLKTERRGLRRFRFPGIKNDHLYQPDYSHQQEGMSCETGGCSPEQRIERQVGEGDEFFVVVHRGTIASGELVIKDAKQRDFLAQQHGLLCFEMEAAGALADFPCMVIRGISDYCDSHKNDGWHGFAAAAAAAYARQLFFHMPIELAQGQYKPTSFNLPFYLPEISRVSKFIAREKELTKMQEALQGTGEHRRVVVLHGLGGIGKTQLAIEYAHRHRKDYSTRVWLDARSETAINQSFAQLAGRILSHDPAVDYITIAVKSQEQSGVVAAVKRWFDEPANNSWLVIYDNYDHPDLSSVGTKDNDLSLPKEIAFRLDPLDAGKEVASEPFDIRKYLPETDHGAIIVTTRVSLKKLGNCIQINKFGHLDDSLEIIASTSGRESIRQGAKPKCGAIAPPMGLLR
ncbi:nb-arc and tpr domain [Trichoderma arundinaceum]|uniref:Nb-arc and tpr domain n=1 Tax=Trichoderma arundinaceum TaxID=490622 RepID=A0A395NQ51_TRIAR|nr:nb-arc and tpr domain [Trichoderma arundinaceum]